MIFFHRLIDIVKGLLFVSIPSLVVLFVLLEVFFRFVIPAAQKPWVIFDRENLMLRSDEKRRVGGIYTIGKLADVKARWRTNNYGWNSSIDYVEGNPGQRLVCLIGDSFIRALQVDVDKSVSSLLRDQLNTVSTEYQVYSFGHDGAPLSQYLHISRYVNRHFSPETLVFLLIHNDFDESVADLVSKPYFLQLRLNGAEVREVQPSERPLYQFLTYSALFRYLYSNLRLARFHFGLERKTGDFNANVDVAAVHKNRRIVRNAAEYVMRALKNENPGKRVLFVMNAPLNDIHDDRLAESSVLWVNEMVRDICEHKELECLDLTTAFAADYARNRHRFTFTDDGHWNEYGHRVASEAVLAQLMSHQDQTPLIREGRRAR